MKLFARFTVLLFCLLLMLVSPAQAGTAWSPGFYAGWISFSARLDTDAKWPAMDAFIIEKYQGRGQLMVKVDDQGQGGASIVLPVNITILDYGYIHTSNGNCTFSSHAVAQTNYVHLRNEMVDVSEGFQSPVALSPGIRFNKTHSASFGSLQGCDQAGAANLQAMQKAMKVTTAEMRQLKFTVTYHDKQSIGGTCTVVGWEKTSPIPNGEGQGVRSLQRCTWRVFKSMTPNQQAEWTQ